MNRLLGPRSKRYKSSMQTLLKGISIDDVLVWLVWVWGDVEYRRAW